MSRTQTLAVPRDLAGTDLRPVLTLLPVPSDGPHGGAEANDGGPGSTGKAIKGAALALVGTHLAVAGLALKDAAAIPDLVWDTAGIPKVRALAKIALLPGVGAAAFTRDLKPRLVAAQDALRLQGG